MPAVLLATVPAGASGTAVGSAATIALVTRAVHHEEALSAYVATSTGRYFFGFSSVATGAWRLDWGYGAAPYPYEHPVTDVETVRFVRGHAMWQTNVFGCSARSACASASGLEVFSTAGATYWGYTQGGAAPACWTRAAGQTSWMARDFGVGWPAWSVSSGTGYTAEDYRPVSRRAGEDVVTSTYRYVPTGQSITEVDFLRPATLTFTALTYHASATSRYRAYTFHVSYSAPSAAPSAPAVTTCAG